jgi:NADH:ubiquinone oxidoreductase subunit 3 (subunit A)
MPANDLFWGFLCAGVTLGLLSVRVILGRRASPVARCKEARPLLSSALARLFPATLHTLLLLGFLCAVGATLMLPWAVSLSVTGPTGLVLGLIFAALPAVGVLYARKTMSE